MKQELLRQGTHAAFSILMIGLWLGVSRIVFIAILAGLIAGGIVIIRNNTKLAKILLSTLERRRNKKRFPGKGAFLLTVGVLLTAVLFPSQFIPAVLIVGLADAASTLVGVWAGSHTIYTGSKKTWEGVMAFFVVSCLVLFWFTPWWPVFTLILTAVESIDFSRVRFLDDNVLLPLLTGLLLFV